MIIVTTLILAFCAFVLIGLLRLIRELLEDFFHPPAMPGDPRAQDPPLEPEREKEPSPHAPAS
jgi:hypothetical protein